MRLLFALMLIVLPAVALAADWSRYFNERFGYEIDIPPGLEGQGEADNSDGQVFVDESGLTTLLVFGGTVVEDDFESEAAQALTFVEDEGWTITYQATTPDWASFSGTSGGRVLYLRVISLCGGTQYAAFHLQYLTKDLAAMDSVVNRLVQSFREAGGGMGC